MPENRKIFSCVKPEKSTGNFMKKLLYLLLILVLALGCEEIPDGVVTPEGSGLSVQRLTSPSVFERTDQDSIISVSVKFDAESDVPGDVWVNLVELFTGEVYSRKNKLTNEGDNTYSGSVLMSQFYPNGEYELQFNAYNYDNETRKLGSKKLQFDNGVANEPPTIVTVYCPDTLTVESPKSVFIIAAEVIDPNGVRDIYRAYVTIVKPNGEIGTYQFPLYDNGSSSIGDNSANDGIFSQLVQMTPENLKGDYTLTFQAEDKSGVLSNEVVHIMHVRE